MLPPDQHRALREHGAVVDGYWSGLEREKERLREPYRERLEQLDAIYRSGVPRADPDTGPMGLMAHVSRAAVEAHDEAQTIHDEVDEHANQWAARNNPRVEPFDSPSRFVAWIDKNMFDARYLEENRHRYQPMGDPSILAKFSYESIYHRARERMMSFLELAPDLVLELPERDDPRRGLREIRNLFYYVQARGPGTGPQATDPTDTMPRPRRLSLSETSWLREVIRALQAVIDSAHRAAGARLPSGQIPNYHRITLWRSIGELEAAIDRPWDAASGHLIEEDLMEAYTWLSAYIRDLPPPDLRMRPEADAKLAAMIVPDQLGTLERMLGRMTHGRMTEPASIPGVPKTGDGPEPPAAGPQPQTSVADPPDPFALTLGILKGGVADSE